MKQKDTETKIKQFLFSIMEGKEICLCGYDSDIVFVSDDAKHIITEITSVLPHKKHKFKKELFSWIFEQQKRETRREKKEKWDILNVCVSCSGI